MKTLSLKPKRGGFTLIELLATVGIILVLAGLGFPAVKSATDRAKQAACIGHGKQLAMANQTYQNDSNGEINGMGKLNDPSSTPTNVVTTNWMTRMRPYFDNVATYDEIRLKYMCPADPQFLKDNAAHVGWAFNTQIDPYTPSGSQNPVGVRLNQVAYPARTIYAIDGYRDYDWSAGDGQNVNFTLPTAMVKNAIPAGQRVFFPHNRSAVAVFLDGHVQLVKAPLARSTWALDGQ